MFLSLLTENYYQKSMATIEINKDIVTLINVFSLSDVNIDDLTTFPD